MIMAQDSGNLIWIDMEMSGLDPDKDRVLELAVVVTDQLLNNLAEAPVLVVHQSDQVLSSMDSWNTSTHTKSGLVERVKASTLTEAEAEQRLIEFLKEYVSKGISPMCGNSVHQDRRFLARYMPTLENYFLYRNLDVSTLKELAKRWRPDLSAGHVKQNKHTALEDIRESIEELKYYRQNFLRV
jgi:oligoribonuclease